jgi:glycerol-3-phosphate dehydrogenase
VSTSEPPPSRPGFAHRGEAEVDLVVIGGGVNGVGVARDATMRGLRVALFERNDLAFGASGNSSGMIHGGARYLVDDPAVTETSCRDSGHIQSIAPHLLFRIPFLFPIERSRHSKIMLTLVDAFFQAYDEYQPLKHGKPHARLKADELHQLEPGLRGDLEGGVSFDEWGIDGARLCTANALDAKERGAKIYLGTTIEHIERREDGRVVAVLYRDLRNGRTGKIGTSAVVNATGAWAPITAALSGLPAHTARVRPGKGIHIAYDRRLTNYAIAARTIDGRQIFIEPWQNMTVVGTTDDDYYGNLDDVVANGEEVRYLVQGIARVFPSITSARPIYTWAGVRPTLFAYGKLEDKLSRDHQIIDHAKHGTRGMWSMIGGKLASYRLFAEEMTDVLGRYFGLPAECHTHRTHLPGGDEVIDPFALAERLAVDAVAARRLVYRHGSRARRIEERIHEAPREASVVCPCEPVLEAEVRHAVVEEMARSVDDVSRRTRLGLGACGGMRCAARCGQIVADERGLPPSVGRDMAMRFIVRQSRTRACALGPEQARQEALAIATMRSELGVDAVELDAQAESEPR